MANSIDSGDGLMDKEKTMKKPCDDCIVNLEQAMLYDEVTCWKTCKDWAKWRAEKAASNPGETVEVIENR